MSYDITAREIDGEITVIRGALNGIESDHCAEHILRALIHAGYEVTIKEKREKVNQGIAIPGPSNGACEAQYASRRVLEGESR